MIEPGDGAQDERDTPAVPWDRKFTEGLARDAWLAANRPSERSREPPLRERVRSPWFWVVVLTVAGLTAARALSTVHGLLAVLLWVSALVVLYGGLYIEGRVRSGP